MAVSPNYLATLTLGWCYILSSRLVEIQGHGATMEYTGSRVLAFRNPSHEVPATTAAVDIGEIDDDAIS